MTPRYSVTLFTLGLITAMLLASLARVMIGMRLGLYLLSRDSLLPGQSKIPITAEDKKLGFWKTISRGLWRENIDLTLSDYEGNSFTFKIGFHLWKRFYLVAENNASACQLDGISLSSSKAYFLHSGMNLTLGTRVFEILVTSSRAKSPDQQNWMESSSIRQ